MEKINCGIQTEMKQGVLKLTILNERIMRVQKLLAKQPAQSEELILTNELPVFEGWTARESEESITIETDQLCAVYDKKSENIRFYEQSTGEEILAELEANFEPDTATEGWFGSAEQIFWATEEEVIGGFGQQADGACNYKGRFVYLNQYNIISAVPVLVSTKGYGVLWNNCSLTEVNRRKTAFPLDFNIYTKTWGGIFRPEQTGQYVWIIEKLNKNQGYEDMVLKVGEEVVIERETSWHASYYTGTIWLEKGNEYPIFTNSAVRVYYQTPSQQNQTSIWSEISNGIDYCVLYGPEAEDIVRGYRQLTGDAPLFPKWAYGYWQSKECYRTGQEVLDVVAEHKRRGHPMDAIVQDWQYWGDFGWNALKVSPEYAENIEEVIDTLHKENVHFMVSVWPNMGESEKSEAYQEFKEKGYLMDDAPLQKLGDYTSALQGFRKNYYDVWNPNARDALWRRIEDGLFQKGVDAWWLDATEPNLWSLQGAYHMYDTCCGPASNRLNAYTLAHSKGIYEHQRQTTDEKRVFILSRTGFAGIQKYGTAVWSGDTWGTWKTFRRQIADGLQYCLSGLPYWTSDIGGFMGDSCDSPEYRELYVRWFQFGAFCPIFRAHGTKIPREVWQFGEETEKILHKYLMLRYQLLPYIYSSAWLVTHYQKTMMRPLWMDYRTDSRVKEICDQYLFGPSLMVCPVTEAGASDRKVYLPAGNCWYDFWNHRYYEGGNEIMAEAPLDKIPLYVKAGSILLMAPESMHTCEENPVEIRIFSGDDAEFIWYRDRGDTYAYENGKYAEVRILWREETEEVKLCDQQGIYKMKGQKFFVTIVKPDGTQSVSPIRQLE